MGVRLKNIDRDTPMIMPPDMRDWLPDDHMVNFIIEAVETVGLQGFRLNRRGSGSRQYPPSMMLSLLIYCYATGRMSSRQIEEASYYDLAVRYICGGSHHPDHDTICKFRVENRELFSECFVKVLALAHEVGSFKKIGGISVDGTKIQANASKHSAVSYKRAGEMIEQLELEVNELMKKAEDADSKALDDGLSIPEEIGRRTDRKEKLEHARKIIEERFEEKRKEKEAEYKARLKKREGQRKEGRKPRGRPPKPPKSTPEDKDQYNFTDPESRIMKAGNGSHVNQAYNAQAAVDIEGSYLILGKDVTTQVNDKQQLPGVVAAVEPEVRKVSEVLVDNGYFSESVVEKVESNGGPVVYAAIGKQSHHKTVKELENREDSPPPPDSAGMKEKMLHRITTKEGKEKYKLRKQTVEPVFGIIKEVMGFRRFHLRGLEKVKLEWDLVTLSYNMKRLYNIVSGGGIAVFGKLQNEAKIG